MNKALKQNKIFLSKAIKKANKYGLYLCDYLEFITSKSIEDMKQRHKRRFGAHIQPNEIKQIGSRRFVAVRSSKGMLLYYSHVSG
jgi:hypothetical protein